MIIVITPEYGQLVHFYTKTEAKLLHKCRSFVLCFLERDLANIPNRKKVY